MERRGTLWKESRTCHLHSGVDPEGQTCCKGRAPRDLPLGLMAAPESPTNLSFFSHPWALATYSCQPGLSHPIFPQYTRFERPGRPSHPSPSQSSPPPGPSPGPPQRACPESHSLFFLCLEPTALRFSLNQLFLIINVLARMSPPQSSCPWPLSITSNYYSPLTEVPVCVTAHLLRTLTPG